MEGLDQHVVGAAPNGLGPQRRVAHGRHKDYARIQPLFDHPAKNFAPIAVGKSDIDNDNFNART